MAKYIGFGGREYDTDDLDSAYSHVDFDAHTMRYGSDFDRLVYNSPDLLNIVLDQRVQERAAAATQAERDRQASLERLRQEGLAKAHQERKESAVRRKGVWAAAEFDAQKKAEAAANKSPFKTHDSFSFDLQGLDNEIKEKKREIKKHSANKSDWDRLIMKMFNKGELEKEKPIQQLINDLKALESTKKKATQKKESDVLNANLFDRMAVNPDLITEGEAVTLDRMPKVTGSSVRNEDDFNLSRQMAGDTRTSDSARSEMLAAQQAYLAQNAGRAFTQDEGELSRRFSLMDGRPRGAVYSEIARILSAEEKRVLDYYLSADPQKAGAFIDSFGPELLQREAERKASETLEADKKAFSPAHIGAAAVVNPLLGVIGATTRREHVVNPFMEGLTNWFEGIDKWQNGPSRYGQNGLPGLPMMGDNFRSQSTDMAAAQLAEDDSRIGRGVKSLVQSTGNMVPSLIMGQFGGPAAGAVTIGLSSGGSAYGDARESGHDHESARFYGIASGAVEGGLSYVLSTLPGLKGRNLANLNEIAAKVPAIGTLKAKLGNVIGGALTNAMQNPATRRVLQSMAGMPGEMLEEYLQSIAEPILKNALLGEDNEISPLDIQHIEAAIQGGLMSFGMNMVGDGTKSGGNTISKWAANASEWHTERTADKARKALASAEPSLPDTAEGNAPGVQSYAGPVSGGSLPAPRNDLVPYSEHQKENWANSKNIVVYESPEQFKEFLQLAKKHKLPQKRIYMGAIPSDLAQDIQADTNLAIDIEGYNVALLSDTVEHDLNDHGSEEAEALRGQRAVTDEDFARVPEVIMDYDYVEDAGKSKSGAPSIRFIKNFDGRTTVIVDVSKKHHSLFVETVFAHKNKGDFPNNNRERSLYHTSETTRGISPTIHTNDSELSEQSPRPETPKAFRAMNPALNAADSEYSGQPPQLNTSETAQVMNPASNVYDSENSEISTNSIPDSGENVNTETDTDVQSFVENTDPELYVAKNLNHPDNENKQPLPFSAIVDKVRKRFGLPVNVGHISQRDAAGIYKTGPQAIRTKMANAVPVIAHELGHHLDNHYKLSRLPEAQEALSVISQNKSFSERYTPDALMGEAMAEFMRTYLTDKTAAREMYPTFYPAFEARMGQHQGVFKNINEVADDINRALYATEAERMSSAIISRDTARKLNRGTPKENAAALKRWIVQKFWDNLAIIGEYSETGYKLAMVSKAARTWAESIITGNFVDSDFNVSRADGLTDIYLDAHEAGITKQELDNYVVDKRGVPLDKQDKRTYGDETLQNSDEMTRRIAEAEALHPQIEAIADRIYAFEDKVAREWIVKTGLMSLKDYEKMRKENPYYVPFRRNMGNNYEGRGGRSGFAEAGSGIKHMKGSGREILSPVESIPLQVEDMVKRGMKQMVMLELVKASERPGGAKVFEKIPPDMVPQIVGTKDLQSGIAEIFGEAAYSGLDQQKLDDLQERVSEKVGDGLTDYVVGKFQGRDVLAIPIRNSKGDVNLEYFQVSDADLLNALKKMTPPQASFFTKIFESVGRVQKYFYTGINLGFGAANAIRDAQTAWLKGLETNPGKFIADLLKQYGNNLIEADSTRQYMGLLGKDNSLLGSTADITGAVDSIWEGEYSDKNVLNSLIANKDKAGAWEAVKHQFVQQDKIVEGIRNGDIKQIGRGLAGSIGQTIQNFENIVNFAENVPRNAEFDKVKRQGGSNLDAMIASMEVTTNFNRSGDFTKVFNALFPYFGASVNGAVSSVQRFISNENGYRTKFIATSLVMGLLQALLAKIDEEEYKKLSNYQKNNFYNIPLGNGRFRKIPKSQSDGWGASLIERAAERVLMDNPHAFDDVFGYITGVFFPPGVPTIQNGKMDLRDMPGDLAGLGPFMEVANNENFMGAPIVPTNLQDLPKREQFNESTSWFAKNFGNVFNISPMQVDHIINSFTGDYGKALQNLTNEKKGDRNPLDLSGRFSGDSVYSSDSAGRFYDRKDALNRNRNSSNATGKDKALYDLYNSESSVLSVLNKLSKADDSRETKKMYRDRAYDAESRESRIDERLAALYDTALDKNGFPFQGVSFSNEFVVTDKVPAKDKKTGKDTTKNVQRSVTLDADNFITFVDEVNAELEEHYDRILSSGLSNENKIKALAQVKRDVKSSVQSKYGKVKDSGGVDGFMKAAVAGVPADTYFKIRYEADTDGNGSLTQDEVRTALNKSNLSQKQKANLWEALGGGNWTAKPYGKADENLYTSWLKR